LDKELQRTPCQLRKLRKKSDENGDSNGGELVAESTCCDSVWAVLENDASAGISTQATGGSNKYVGGRLAVAHIVGREHVLHAAENLDKRGG
jgi:hypothetical protein